MIKYLMGVCALGLLVGGCTPVSQLQADVQDNARDKISVGTVQREIKVGMSGEEVISVLGAPNMVTSDAQRRETWVYDKVATTGVSSSSSGGIWLLLAGVKGNSSAASTSQRTLTIIIKFDDNGLVRDYSYRQSSF